jgi:hypothetical protein
VEINFSLIEAAISNEHCANFEAASVLFCDGLVTWSAELKGKEAADLSIALWS